MFSENHFEDFLTSGNFYLAFERLRTASRNLYKELYYEDIKIFGLFLDDNIKLLLKEIEQGLFKPESSYKIFVTKKNNLVRPLSLLKFKDLLVYQAIINIIADAVYDDIAPYYNNIIFGNIYTTSNDSERERFFFSSLGSNNGKSLSRRQKIIMKLGIIFYLSLILHHFSTL
jgi:hypothetical protein